MKPTRAVATITGALRDFVNVPVRTSGMEGERPVPSVILDDWELQELNLHNTDHVGTTKTIDIDDDGTNEYVDWYHVYYDMRVELVVRHDDDVTAHELVGDVQDALRVFKEHPQMLHSDVNTVSPGTSGRLSYQFAEPKETEINQSFSLNAFHEMAITAEERGEDVLQTIRNTFNTLNE